MEQKMGYFEKLRAKPLAYRRAYALVVSLSLTSIIGLIWLVSTISTLSATANNPEQTASVSSNLSVFSLIKDQFSTLMEDNPFSSGEIMEDGMGNENLVQ